MREFFLSWEFWAGTTILIGVGVHALFFRMKP